MEVNKINNNHCIVPFCTIPAVSSSTALRVSENFGKQSRADSHLTPHHHGKQGMQRDFQGRSSMNYRLGSKVPKETNFDQTDGRALSESVETSM